MRLRRLYLDCELRKYANDFGVDIPLHRGGPRKYKVDPSHPFIILDPNKCIACGRCVRTCSDILKISALGFVHRGFNSIVKPSMEKKLLQTDCISCGNCIAACPTGAITEHLPFPKPGPWRGKRADRSATSVRWDAASGTGCLKETCSPSKAPETIPITRATSA